MTSLPAFAKGVDPAHQSCETDDECQVLTIGCACIHNSTCAGPEDRANGIVDGVSRKFAKTYEARSNCSDAETRRCATAGACAARGAWVPRCEKQACTVVFKPAGSASTQ